VSALGSVRPFAAALNVSPRTAGLMTINRNGVVNYLQVSSFFYGCLSDPGAGPLSHPRETVDADCTLAERRAVGDGAALTALGDVPSVRAGDAADQHSARPQWVPAWTAHGWPDHPTAGCRPHQLADASHELKVDRFSVIAIAAIGPPSNPSRTTRGLPIRCLLMGRGRPTRPAGLRR
jgi:hypothetical protein